MHEPSVIDKLNEKVTQILQKHQALQEEANVLRGEMGSKDEEIAKLREEISLKDMEIEEIVAKIESILG